MRILFGLLLVGHLLLVPLLAVVAPTLTLSAHNGYAPLHLTAIVRQPAVAVVPDDMLCLSWGPVQSSITDPTDLLAGVEAAGVSCKPSARRVQYELVLSKGTYVVAAHVERDHHILVKSIEQSVRVLAAADDPVGDPH